MSPVPWLRCWGVSPLNLQPPQVPLYPHQKGGSWVGDQVAVEIQTGVTIICQGLIGIFGVGALVDDEVGPVVGQAKGDRLVNT